MSAAQDFLDFLSHEEQILRARKFDQLADLAPEKERLAGLITADTDRPTLEAIRHQVSVNEELLSTLARAATSLRTRIEKLAAKETAVGYNVEGESLSFEKASDRRRV